MSDIVVTVPKNFTYGYGGKRGLAAWLSEGDAPGEVWDGEFYSFSTWGFQPRIKAGERVYICCQTMIVGYAPLVAMFLDDECVESGGDDFGNVSLFRPGKQARLELVRGGGAVAVTIPQQVIGFRGWRYRWWDYAVETPLDLSPWLIPSLPPSAPADVTGGAE